MTTEKSIPERIRERREKAVMQASGWFEMRDRSWDKYYGLNLLSEIQRLRTEITAAQRWARRWKDKARTERTERQTYERQMIVARELLSNYASELATAFARTQAAEAGGLLVDGTRYSPESLRVLLRRAEAAEAALAASQAACNELLRQLDAVIERRHGGGR